MEEGDTTTLMCGEIRTLAPAEAVISLMECPICQGVPMPPIWNCKGGHITCDRCRCQILHCGLCRQGFTGGRNYFMEAIILASLVSCPYEGIGCTEVTRGDLLQSHILSCSFGPKINWVPCSNGSFPENAVEGGQENGVRLYVIRSPHQGSITPGKLLASSPNQTHASASLVWGGAEHYKSTYEVLTAATGCVKWIPSRDGEILPMAVVGGRSEIGEPLYIGRVTHEGSVVNGKIHPSHGVCYIPLGTIERAFENYEILVKESE